jgi:hypothetical protein
MPFKYYVYNDEGLDGWVELLPAVQKKPKLSGKLQAKLENFDAIARRYTTGAMVGYMFRIGELPYAPGRPANYEVRAVDDQVVHMRLLRFDDGEVVEVRYVQEPPPFYEVGFHSPARV